MSELKIKGYVRKWLPNKAFGFITSVDGSGNSESYFVHISEIEGVESPCTVSVPNSDTTLVLNGAGIRKKFFMNIYIGALYLASKTTEATTILNDNGAASDLQQFL